jgi:tetratricopeptide (TPR) repeat protein
MKKAVRIFVNVVLLLIFIFAIYFRSEIKSNYFLYRSASCEKRKDYKCALFYLEKHINEAEIHKNVFSKDSSLVFMYRFHLARLHSKNNDYDKSIEIMSKLIEKYPEICKNRSCYTNLGRFYYLKGDYANALNSLNKNPKFEGKYKNEAEVKKFYEQLQGKIEFYEDKNRQ